MSDINFEQSYAIRLGHSATDFFAKLQQAYEDSVLSIAQIFQWFMTFSSIQDKPYS